MLLSVKLKRSEHAIDSDYKNKVNASDFRQIALLLTDLEIHGVPVEKAFQEFKSMKTKEFPW